MARYSIEFDTHEVDELARDLAKAPERVVVTSRGAVRDAAKKLRDDWRSNARATARRHGKHYPRSITHEAVGLDGLTYEVGPEFGKLQGRMGRGFEYGSRNQPPHLDGNRAADGIERELARDLAPAAERAI